MNNGIIIEISPFQVAKGVTDEKLLEASEVLQREFLSQQKGFLRRDLVKGDDGLWIDMVYWASESDARTATQNASESEESFAFFELLDLSSLYNMSNSYDTNEDVCFIY